MYSHPDSASTSIVHVTITGMANSTILVDVADTVSSIFKILNIDEQQNATSNTSHVVFNGQVLSPALSLMFYGIGEGSQLVLIQKRARVNNSSCNSSQFSSPCTSISSSSSSFSLANVVSFQKQHRQQDESNLMEANNLYRNRSYTHLVSTRLTPDRLDDIGCCNSLDFGKKERFNDQKKVKRFFEEKCTGKVRDPEIALQRFQDAVDPRTALESARITDVYRSRVESNSNSFRRLCKKYVSLTDCDTPKNNMSPNNNTLRRQPSATRMQTVLPGKADEPSTGLLPELIIYPISHL